MIRRALLLAAVLLSGVGGAYTVKPGDTLYSLARANGTTVAELVRLNGLTGTALAVGQTLRLPGEEASSPAVPTPEPSSRPGAALQLGGLTVTAPASLRMGDPFVLRLSGPRAAEASVRFPSEVGEDVRLPGEALTPVPAGGGRLVLGRVVLGKTTPVVYEIRVGSDVLRGRIPVTGLTQAIQRLNLPPRIAGKLEDPARKAEDAAVEQAYARRTPQVWSRTFQPAAKVRAQSSAFGQPRTYVAGGPVLYHYGTDYPAPAGTPVLAVNDGTVVMAGMYPVRGGLVVIDHGAGLTSMYFHQSRVTVNVGQQVTRGQKVGEVGSTGLSTGAHLHLEMRVRGEATDPAKWMSRVWPK
ncbi:peptidase M23 (plasmid) [Deinococcus aetherius]|uniref:Peptidase M23 n=1 Tax=Deinococcus aetherius TaxID=200252 RepID=A0ABM8ALU0_9DEIO|nr:M23 family metallopeptidase [Deinococcus aetherius]BDP44721.1 peptidase M23 [Deinococcus aetherius]